MIDFATLLKGSFFEDDTECIQATFERAGIVREESLANAPRILGGRPVCGHNVFYLVSEIARMLRGEPKFAYTEAELEMLDEKLALEAEEEEE